MSGWVIPHAIRWASGKNRFGDPPRASTSCHSAVVSVPSRWIERTVQSYRPGVTDRNPQAKEMADESMVRNLSAQAEAIWPQELPLVRRYSARDILDVGCGTGEITVRLAAEFPDARITGIDL